MHYNSITTKYVLEAHFNCKHVLDNSNEHPQHTFNGEGKTISIEYSQHTFLWRNKQNYHLILSSNACTLKAFYKAEVHILHIMILNFQKHKAGQTVQTQIRLLIEEQSDQSLHCFLFHLHCLDVSHHHGTMVETSLFKLHTVYSKVSGSQKNFET